MPLTPDSPFPKTQGDNVRSKDWNDALNEVIRLDSAKVNRAGDQITGSLTVNGNVGVGTTNPSSPLHVADHLTVGPFPSRIEAAPGRLEVSGPAAELAFIRRDLTAFPAPPAAGDRYVWYNPDGAAHFWTEATGDLLVVTGVGNVGIGIGAQNPRRKLHVEGSTEIHSGGTGAGLSFANREPGSFVELPAAGERWVFYASGGSARLWSGGDKLTVAPNGDLTVAGRLSALNLCAGAPAFRIGAGKTVAGATNWLVYSPTGIVVSVDTTIAGFTKTPVYVTSLHGSGGHWATTGGTSVYVPTPTGFSIYVKWSDNSALTPLSANQNQWHIQWIGVEI